MHVVMHFKAVRSGEGAASVRALCASALWGVVLAVGLSTLPAVAQEVTAVGTGATFDVATWNVEWFGAANGPSDDDRQLDHVEAVIEGAGVDLWALQEVADVDAFERLLDSLGTAFDGFYRDNASRNVTQRLAFVYDPEVVQVRRVEQILTPQYDHAFAFRPPLKVDLDVVLPDTIVALTVITLHMKAGGDGQDYERRREAAVRLKNRIDVFYPNARLVVLGDFNDELGRSIAGGRTSPYDVFLEDTDAYRFLTQPLDEHNTPTWCGNSASCTSGSTLDHILITDELFSAVETADRYVELTQEVEDYVFTTSDHLPVYARFSFEPSTTAVEADAPDRALAFQAVYPNPVRGHATIRFALPRPGPVRIEVYDLLGRRAAVAMDGFRAAGSHVVRFDASTLPEGTYLIRLEAGAATAVQRMVHLR